MKKEKFSLSEFAQKLQEKDGKLDGGFAVILFAGTELLLESEPANNCNGGNCVQGCGTNNIAGCGGTVNNVAGCGKALSSAY